MTTPISRRTALRGLGTALALPWLDAMAPLASAAGGAVRQGPPKRLGFFYVPNGANMADWTPKAEGVNFELPAILEPLAPFKQDLFVLSGLTLDKARPNGDGPGDHARALAAFLTGRQARKTHGADIRAGISVDQYAALAASKHTKFPSLEIGCEGGRQSGNCDSGYSCAYSSSVAWRAESSPLGKEINPRLLFERLFSNGPKNESAAGKAKRERHRLSILDLVMEDANQLKNRLGAKDQGKLEEYLTGVRELEVRIARSDKEGESNAGGFPKPAGVPTDYQEHLRILGDLLALAFQGDLTRVGTFVFANEGSNRSYRHIGVPEGHHDLSHHGGDAKKKDKIKQINRFHMTQFAYFLNRLKSIKEGEGTLLDNCMLVYGSGIGDGNAHNHDNLPVLLVGNGGGTLKPGRHLKYPKETPLTNLYLSLLDRMDVKLETLGDSTGRLVSLT